MNKKNRDSNHSTTEDVPDTDLHIDPDTDTNILTHADIHTFIDTDTHSDTDHRGCKFFAM